MIETDESSVTRSWPRFRLAAALAPVIVLGSAPASIAQSPPLDCVASNHSTPTRCAEEDNVNISLSRRSLRSFAIEATHPSYAVARNDCAADFTNCSPPSGSGYSFTPGTFKLFDDGETVVEAVRESSWWRPRGMAAAVDARTPFAGVHYVRLSRKIAGAEEWPQFLVLYADGNLRLIPHPPVGERSVCFGSSVIVGPARVAARPLAEIRSVRYLPASQALQVSYRSGGSATLTVEAVNRVTARIRVSVNYPTRRAPFATFRSMFVGPGSADVDHVRWRDRSQRVHIEPVDTFSGGRAREWFFFRRSPSQHNTTAPNMRIIVRV